MAQKQMQGSLTFSVVAPAQLAAGEPLPISDAVVGWLVDSLAQGVSDGLLNWRPWTVPWSMVLLYTNALHS